jgi:hypothetical protein
MGIIIPSLELRVNYSSGEGVIAVHSVCDLTKPVSARAACRLASILLNAHHHNTDCRNTPRLTITYPTYCANTRLHMHSETTMMTPRCNGPADPQVPNMVPHSDNGSPAALIDILRSKLGSDASLLQSIPIHKVQMELQHDAGLEAFLAHKICLGTMRRDDMDWILWAYMCASTRKERLPDINIFAFHPRNNRDFVQITAAEVPTRAILRDEFKMLTYNLAAFAAVIKAS